MPFSGEAYPTGNAKMLAHVNESVPPIQQRRSDVPRELAEIDENLMRSNLDAMGLGESLVRRKEIYEELNPEKKHANSRPIT
jgi:hypothetical protein